MKKTFKPGEYCFYPSLIVEAEYGAIKVIGINYNGTVGTQRNFKYETLNDLEFWLEEISTYYYATMVRDWIKSTKHFRDHVSLSQETW